MIRKQTRSNSAPKKLSIASNRNRINAATPKAEKDTKERVFIRMDESRMLQDYATIDEWCNLAEYVLKVCKQYNLNPTVKQLHQYTTSRNTLVEDIAKTECSKYEDTRLRKAMEREIFAELVEVCPHSLWNGVEQLPTRLLKYILLSDEGIDINTTDLEEDCKVYATGHALKVYREIEQAAKHLNNVFCGNTWKFADKWHKAVFWVDDNGVIHPRKDIGLEHLGK